MITKQLHLHELTNSALAISAEIWISLSEDILSTESPVVSLDVSKGQKYSE